MRTAITTTPRGLQARAIAGTYVVLLAFNCPDPYRQGLLGFSIQRLDHENDEVTWLRGGKRFPQKSADDAGHDVSSRTDPIQKFHWGDYTAKAGRTYTYRIFAREGQPDTLTTRESIELTVTCEDPAAIGNRGHQVHFNRSAAASQAYAARFGDKDPEVVGRRALTWLSRGLEEALIAYIDAVQPGESLHLFVYEFEKPEFLEALQRAKKRGVKLRILYDAIVKTTTDKKTGTAKKTGPSVKSVPAMKRFGLASRNIASGRSGAGLNISHNKFMVRADASGRALTLWTGSTNWTDNGVYMQTNVGHAVADPALAQTYLDWHAAVWAAPTLSAAQSRLKVRALTMLPPATAATGSFLVLSPRATIEAVDECAARVGAARQLVCFTAPFALHDHLETALAAAPAQVFGLLNKESVVGPVLHAAPNTQLASAAALDKPTALELWQQAGHEESMHHSGVFIHTKIILVDPLSETPLVVSGSANFSTNSSKNNDENQLFIFGEKEVADVYLGEFMRMFDHYYFRAYVKRHQPAARKPGGAAAEAWSPGLAINDTWTDEFFGRGPKQKLREAFF